MGPSFNCGHQICNIERCRLRPAPSRRGGPSLLTGVLLESSLN
jgi:hypothetical protein